MMAISIVAFSICALQRGDGFCCPRSHPFSPEWGDQPGTLLDCTCLSSSPSGASNIVAEKQKHCAGFDLVLEIRIAVVKRMKELSLGFYTGERLGEIGDIVHKDIDNMEMVVEHLWTRMTADFIVAATLFAGAIIIDWRMALLMGSTLPFALTLLAMGAERLRPSKAGMEMTRRT